MTKKHTPKVKKNKPVKTPKVKAPVAEPVTVELPEEYPIEEYKNNRNWFKKIVDWVLG